MDDDVNSPALLATWARIIRFVLGGMLLLFVGKCVDPLWNWPNYVLPPSLRIDAVLASDSESGLLEGCQAAIYRLAPEPLMQLNREGIDYLNRNRPAKGDQASNPYGPWRETPGEIDLKRNGEGSGTHHFWTVRARWRMSEQQSEVQLP